MPLTLTSANVEYLLMMSVVDVSQVTFKCLRTRLRWLLSTCITPSAPVRSISPHFSFVYHLNATNTHMCECSTGDISVLAHCKSLSIFNAFECNGVTGKHIPPYPPCFIFEPFFADEVCWRCFAGDIQVFENTPSMTFMNLAKTKCTGKDAFYAHFCL